MLESMEPGDLPIIVEVEGRVIELDKRVKKDPVNISILLKLYTLVILKGEEEQELIKKPQDLLDLEGFDWTR